jgi:L-2,4-diaminobutyrate decarboxylase
MDERLLAATLAAIEQDMSPEAGQAFVALTSEALRGASQGQGPLTTRHTPETLAARFSEPPPREGRPLEEVLAMLSRDVLADSLRLAHPMYMGPPVPPPLPAAAWAEATVGALNQSVRALAMSPAGTLLETQLVRWMADQVGYGPSAGGTFTSGGTESNVTALLAARAACMPDAWRKGVGENPPVVLCAENAHYTVFRAVAELGLGLERALTVPLRDFRLDPAALEARLGALREEGRPVMAVVATAGAFGTGAFDDLDAIGRLCEAYGVWFHVDACHGGTALLSREHRHRLRGIERAHSVAWDPHKMMLVPLSAAVLLVKEEKYLDRTFLPREEYPAGDARRLWDQARRSFMASRRLDALKVWVALQRYGVGGLEALYDYLCHLTQVLHERLQAREDFESFHAPDCNILSFRYVGDGTLDDAALDTLNLKVWQGFMREDLGWIATATIHGRFALRVTMMNPLTRTEHLDQLLDGLAGVARGLLDSRPELRRAS